MKILLMVLFLVSCAHKPEPEIDLTYYPLKSELEYFEAAVNELKSEFCKGFKRDLPYMVQDAIEANMYKKRNV